ncbi:hypothetical protein POUND7_017256, partial [Theobroma cacao]
MELGFLLHALIPSWNSASNSFLSRNSCLFPWKRLLTLLSLIGLLGLGSKMNLVSPTLISDRGLELLSASFMFSFLVATALYIAGCRCRSQASSLKLHLTGDLLLDWYMGVQLSPHFMGIDLNYIHVMEVLYHEEQLTSKVLGYRGANNQKHTFKKNPKALVWGKPPKVIGGQLLASGYWGIARHYNYFGDFLLSLSFSLTCGI